MSSSGGQVKREDLFRILSGECFEIFQVLFIPRGEFDAFVRIGAPEGFYRCGKQRISGIVKDRVKQPCVQDATLVPGRPLPLFEDKIFNAVEVLLKFHDGIPGIKMMIVDVDDLSPRQGFSFF